MQHPNIQGVEIRAVHKSQDEILTDEAIEFLVKLHKKFNTRRLELLQRRVEKQKRINAGERLDFLAETEKIRNDPSWKVVPTPSNIQKRWVEITGPTDRKMVINAMNSGADVFMADFEDANSPTWDNLIEGQINVRDAVKETIFFESQNGKQYVLNKDHAVLFVRPRGWHLKEKHFLIQGEEISGSLFDFGLFMFHNVKRTTPYFYLPKLQSYLEARLWNDVFLFAQEELGIAPSTIRATVLIETIHTVFEMEEILYELRDHSGGLNAGRWDYIFSIIKTFRRDENLHLPDRDQITMTVPFMRAYTELLVKTCHKRGAHAIGGMSAFIPNRKDPEVTQRALKKVQEDKLREVQDGCDGTWVAHPDLVPIVREIFETKLGDKDNQKERLREDVQVSSRDLTNFVISEGTVTEEGLRKNINIALQYIYSWLSGIGAAAINNLMEDVATAEISRAQVWQWRQSLTRLDSGETIDEVLLRRFVQEEVDKINQQFGEAVDHSLFNQVRELFERLIFAEHFIEFLTIPAYEKLK